MKIYNRTDLSKPFCKAPLMAFMLDIGLTRFNELVGAGSLPRGILLDPKSKKSVKVWDREAVFDRVRSNSEQLEPTDPFLAGTKNATA